MTFTLDRRGTQSSWARPCVIVDIQHMQVVHIDSPVLIVRPGAAEDIYALADDRGGVPLSVVWDVRRSAIVSLVD
eukprot:scaffold110019_cov32-Tisochrysis_lutea.AAC.4